MTTFQSFDSLYPGQFLKAGLFNGQPATYTITDIIHQELEGEKGPETKVVMSFKETPLKLVLAKINAIAIKAMFGPQVPEWIGKRVTFYGTTAIMPMPTKKDEPCIRVYGSPEISEEIKVSWTPPRRKTPVVQILKPVVSPTLTAALGKVAAATSPDELAAIQKRADELLGSGGLNEAEHAKIVAAISARAPEPEPTPTALSLADKRKLKAQIESHPPAKQQAIYAALKSKFNVTAIQTPEHAVYVNELLTGAGAPQDSDQPSGSSGESGDGRSEQAPSGGAEGQPDSAAD